MNTPQRDQPKTSNSRFTPYQNRRGSSSGCFTPFKSPALKKQVASPVIKDNEKVELAKEVVALRKKIAEIDAEINELGEEYVNFEYTFLGPRRSLHMFLSNSASVYQSIWLYHEDELQVHIDKLHEYNDLKDVAQMVLGKLAEIEGTTTRHLYERYDLDLDD